MLAVAADQLPLFDELCKRERAPYAVIGEANRRAATDPERQPLRQSADRYAAGRAAGQNAEDDPRRADAES